MGCIDVIVIGSSAGGIRALQELVKALPADFTIPVFIVQHVAANASSQLPSILEYSGSLPAFHPVDGEIIKPGNIYVAPPDHHMLIEEDHILIKKGPKENRFRPSIDALFRSAAYTYGSGAVGVILTGMLDDGTSGMWSIKRMGGTTIVQTPENAMYPSMPLSVIEYVEVDHLIPLTQIADVLSGLTHQTAKKSQATQAEQEMRLLETEIKIAAQQNALEKGILDLGNPSSLTCPDCGGALASFLEGKLVRYRCHTGHAYTAQSLLEEVTETVEKKLYQALRSLEEMIILAGQCDNITNDLKGSSAGKGVQIRTHNVEKSADALRALISLRLWAEGQSALKK